MVTLVGNAATAVEHRQTTAGATVARFRLAATSRRWDKALERWTDGETSFYTVRSWRGLADNVAASVAVGEPLIVQGRLRLREGEQSPERGGQRWFAAEVDAVAIGHDLARGTAAFRRVARPARTGTDSTAPAAPQPAQPPAHSSGSAQAAQPHGQQEGRDETLSAAGTAPAKEAPSRPAGTASGCREDSMAPTTGGGRRAPVVPAAGTPARAGEPPTVESSTITRVPPPLGPPDPSVPPPAAGADSPEKVAVS
ncbi:single-stranded DNA-binding protein [Streptomyces sp. TM32]|uniref:single-stranded DNA-binding protein n=1 Tax=Streptomyces sp. TM32 TaxID=1652669 RepID=UPI0020B16132|nr:single-stranded DNA-binding protein [Streptomyces sp. TM32]